MKTVANSMESADMDFVFERSSSDAFLEAAPASAAPAEETLAYLGRVGASPNSKASLQPAPSATTVVMLDDLARSAPVDFDAEIQSAPAIAAVSVPKQSLFLPRSADESKDSAGWAFKNQTRGFASEEEVVKFSRSAFAERTKPMDAPMESAIGLQFDTATVQSARESSEVAAVAASGPAAGEGVFKSGIEKGIALQSDLSAPTSVTVESLGEELKKLPALAAVELQPEAGGQQVGQRGGARYDAFGQPVGGALNPGAVLPADAAKKQSFFGRSAGSVRQEAETLAKVEVPMFEDRRRGERHLVEREALRRVPAKPAQRGFASAAGEAPETPKVPPPAPPASGPEPAVLAGAMVALADKEGKLAEVPPPASPAVKAENSLAQNVVIRGLSDNYASVQLNQSVEDLRYDVMQNQEQAKEVAQLFAMPVVTGTSSPEPTAADPFPANKASTESRAKQLGIKPPAVFLPGQQDSSGVIVERQIESVRSGNRVPDERADDLSVRLASPSGQDVLLSENRGDAKAEHYAFGFNAAGVQSQTMAEGDEAAMASKYTTELAFGDNLAALSAGGPATGEDSSFEVQAGRMLKRKASKAKAPVAEQQLAEVAEAAEGEELDKRLGDLQGGLVGGGGMGGGGMTAMARLDSWKMATEEFHNAEPELAQQGLSGKSGSVQRKLDKLNELRSSAEREIEYTKSKLNEAARQLTVAEKASAPADLEKRRREVEIWQTRVGAAQLELDKVEQKTAEQLQSYQDTFFDGGDSAIEAGDMVHVFVLEDESLSGSYRVDANGWISIPRLGAVQLRGKELPGAERELKRQLEADPLKQATVMVERSSKAAVEAVEKKRKAEEARKKAEAEAKAKRKAAEEAAKKQSQAKPPKPKPNPEILTKENAFSTFSLNVSDVSFELAAASLEQGRLPEQASVRSEEFINAFDYHDPAPTGGDKLAFAWERAGDPFQHNRDLIRFSIQTAAIGREGGQPLNIVVLLDNSGSMERADRLAIVRQALRTLAAQMTPNDRISIVAFARTPRLWVNGMRGGDPDQLVGRVINLNPEGGTNLEAALDLGYEVAQTHYLPNGNNRVILFTDGAANLGDIDPERLKAMTEAQRKRGVALDCFGIGWEGYNDGLLEALSRNADGRYGFLNSPEEADAGFADQLAGSLRVAASNVKAQVEFNPRRVVSYRQIGYEKRQLKKEQFRDNTVDAAEIGAAEAGTALYSIQVNHEGEGPIGVARIRFMNPATGIYEELEWPLPYRKDAPALKDAPPSMRLAGAAASFAEWLAGSPYAGGVSPVALQNLLGGVAQVYANDGRPKQLETMIQQARQLSGMASK